MEGVAQGKMSKKVEVENDASQLKSDQGTKVQRPAYRIRGKRKACELRELGEAAKQRKTRQ